MVKVREVERFSEMLAAPKALMMTGGATTVIEALEVLPVPPSVEVTWTLLFFAPAVVPVMFTEIVQEVFTASVLPESEMLPEPATAVVVPPQVLVSALGVATTRPAGPGSVKATPVGGMGLAPRFVVVEVSAGVPVRRNPPSPHAFAIRRGGATLSLARA